MILRYVSRVLVCKLHPSRVARCARYFQWDVLITNPRFRGRSSLPLLLFRSLSSLPFAPSVLPFFIPVVAEKAFHSAVENALHATRHSRPIIL